MVPWEAGPGAGRGGGDSGAVERGRFQRSQLDRAGAVLSPAQMRENTGRSLAGLGIPFPSTLLVIHLTLVQPSLDAGQGKLWGS